MPEYNIVMQNIFKNNGDLQSIYKLFQENRTYPYDAKTRSILLKTFVYEKAEDEYVREYADKNFVQQVIVEEVLYDISRLEEMHQYYTRIFDKDAAEHKDCVLFLQGMKPSNDASAFLHMAHELYVFQKDKEESYIRPKDVKKRLLAIQSSLDSVKDKYHGCLWSTLFMLFWRHYPSICQEYLSILENVRIEHCMYDSLLYFFKVSLAHPLFFVRAKNGQCLQIHPVTEEIREKINNAYEAHVKPYIDSNPDAYLMSHLESDDINLYNLQIHICATHYNVLTESWKPASGRLHTRRYLARYAIALYRRTVEMRRMDAGMAALSNFIVYHRFMARIVLNCLSWWFLNDPPYLLELVGDANELVYMLIMTNFEFNEFKKKRILLLCKYLEALRVDELGVHSLISDDYDDGDEFESVFYFETRFVAKSFKTNIHYVINNDIPMSLANTYFYWSTELIPRHREHESTLRKLFPRFDFYLRKRDYFQNVLEYKSTCTRCGAKPTYVFPTTCYHFFCESCYIHCIPSNTCPKCSSKNAFL